MKTLIIIRKPDYQWIGGYFNEIHPLLLPLCNKPLAEYLIDFAILAGASEIRIISDTSLSDVEQYCENGSRWGVEISYGSIHSDDTLQTAIDKNRRFCKEERVLVISGLLFIRYSKKRDYKALFESLPEGEILHSEGGSVTLTGNPSAKESGNVPEELSLAAVDSIKGYFDLSMEILQRDADNYVLPGYGSEEGCLIGRNVMISKSAEIRKPCIIGNNVQIHAGSVINSGTVIGSNVIIDRESTISGSIVMDDTYIGEKLDVTSKIVCGSILIDAEAMTSITMQDPHLLTEIKQPGYTGHLLQGTLHAIIAFILLMVLALPFLILCPVLILQGKWINRKKTYFINRTGGKGKLLTATIERRGFAGALAAAISLDRFMLLPKVLTGRLGIIGSKPLEVNPKAPMPLNRMATYRPGVFSYAEAEAWPETGADTEIVDHYYRIHGTPLNDVSMTMKALINRNHETSSP